MYKFQSWFPANLGKCTKELFSLNRRKWPFRTFEIQNFLTQSIPLPPPPPILPSSRRPCVSLFFRTTLIELAAEINYIINQMYTMIPTHSDRSTVQSLRIDAEHAKKVVEHVGQVIKASEPLFRATVHCISPLQLVHL